MRWPRRSRAAKGDDPLAPVAVIVPTNTAGVMARRALGRRGGAAAIDVLTVFRLAELLGAPSLHGEGRKPGLHAGGRPRRQAGHPRLPRPVRRRQPPPLDRRRPPRPLPRAARRRPRVADGAGRHRPRARAGACRRRRRPAARPVVVRRGRPPRPGHRASPPRRARSPPARRRPPAPAAAPAGSAAPRRARRAGQRRARRRHSPATPTPTPRSSPSPRRWPADRCTRPFDAAPPPTGELTVVVDHRRRRRGAHRLSAPSSTPPAPAPASTASPCSSPPTGPTPASSSTSSTAAGIPWNGRPGTGVGERMVPRVLAELLELDRRGLRRSAVMTLLGDVPARRPDGRTVPTARWERIGRAAGVVREEDWHPHLVRYADDVRDATSPIRAPRPTALELLAFVAELRAALGDPAVAAPVGGVGRLGQGAARVVVRAWWARPPRRRRARGLGADHQGARPPRPPRLDRRAGDPRRVPRHVRRRARRHARGGAARSATASTSARSPARPVSMSTSPCSSARPKGWCRHGRPSTRCSATSSASSPDWRDRPSGPRSSTASSSPSPPPRRRSRSPSHAATCGRRRRTTSRAGSPRSSTPAGRARSSSTPTPTGWRRPSSPSPPSEHRLRAAVVVHPRRRRHPRPAARRPTTSISGGRCASATRGRATEFTEFDGNLTGRAVAPLPATVSPTRIETWAGCPHAYFVQYVLGARPIDEPADIETLSPLDRGTAIHDAIDRLHRAVLDGTLPQPGAVRLDRRARRGPAARRRRGGRRPPRRRAHRAGRRSGSTPGPSCSARSTPGWRSTASDGPAASVRSSEQDFGDDERVELMLPDGRAVGFRGKIDRIDELPDGTLVVTDHKSGKPDKLGSVSADDPTLAGRRFQLPVYAAAARALLGRPKAPVRAGLHVLQAEVRPRRAGARRRCRAARRRRAGSCRRRHRVGGLPGDPRASGLGAVQLVLVLRSRRTSAPRRRGRTGSASGPIDVLAALFPLDDEEPDADG